MIFLGLASSFFWLLGQYGTTRQWNEKVGIICFYFYFSFPFFLLVSVPLDRRDDRSNRQRRLFFVGCVVVNDKASPLLFCNFLIFWRVGGQSEVTVGIVISSCLFSSSFWLLGRFGSTRQANNRSASSAFSVTFFLLLLALFSTKEMISLIVGVSYSSLVVTASRTRRLPCFPDFGKLVAEMKQPSAL